MNLIQQLEAEAIEQFKPARPFPNSAPATRSASASRWSKANAPASRITKASASPAPISGLGSSFTVRKISFGEGVERVFPLYSPNVETIEVVRRGAVRRAKLYYLRGRTGKAARIAERRDTRHLDEAKAEAKAAKAPETETAEG